MTDDAHDMGLMALLINGIAHCLAVDCETFVLFPVGLVPALQGEIEVEGSYTDKDIADNVLAWNHIAAVFATAAEPLTRLGAEAIGPVRDGLVSAHPTQDCSCCNGQHGGKSMASPLGAAGIGDIGKEVG